MDIVHHRFSLESGLRERGDDATVQPLGIVETDPPMPLEVIGRIPVGWDSNKIVGFSAFIILTRLVEEMRQHAGTEANQPLFVTSLCCRNEVFPGELKAVQVGGDRVVDAARIEREAAIEPPAVHTCAVTLAK